MVDATCDSLISAGKSYTQQKGGGIIKILVCLTCIIVLSASAVLAQGGTYALYTDPLMAECSLSDTEPNTVLQFYVFHLFSPGVAAATFSMPIPTCATGLTWLSDVRVFPVTMGFSATGISVAYQGCLSSPIHCLSVQYWAQGLSSECCYLDFAPNPIDDPNEIVAVDCDNNHVPALGVPAIINPNSTCPCFNVPVEESTWGKVKALYAK